MFTFDPVSRDRPGFGIASAPSKSCGNSVGLCPVVLIRSCEFVMRDHDKERSGEGCTRRVWVGSAKGMLGP
jgi:hypothetical protein